MTVFLGCGFAAKYREGGGNFSVPLQWMLGLRRLKLDAVWVELLPAARNLRDDEAKIDNFRRQLRGHGLAGRYCLLYQKPANDIHDLDAIRCIGISKRELLDRLAGPNTLLNLCYSIHPPLLLQFERRIFCDLDPSEIFYWMTKVEMGQSHHHQFWTIGLNVHSPDCGLPKSGLKWKTFYPLVDPHRVARTPRKYRSYIGSALAEFTAIKGVDVAWQTGWLSDRAASFLASGRAVVTEDTGATKYLPLESGFRFVSGQNEAIAAIKEVLSDWPKISRQARRCAVEVFDSVKNVRKILDL